MNDLETLKKMLEKANIKYEEDNGNPDNPVLVVEGGYSGFVTEFTFNQEGELYTIGAYE